ncbi:hypothetical protein TNCV_600591 [Trichonephila clavipes]|nr:hypothetical protein TNCV_600591 [Trichonephila clavipes]
MMNFVGLDLDFTDQLGKTPTETYEGQALFMKCAYEWFARFREGWESVSDNPRSERPTFVSDEIIEKVSKLITKDCRLTVRMVAER